MEYRRLGNSDIEVSVIAFGGWAIGGWMWGGADEDDALAAIEKALEMGITTIDTAAVYGFGRSEEIVGKAIAGKRDKVQVLTKYGMRWDTEEGSNPFDTFDEQGHPVRIMRNSRPESVITECEASLKRLGTDYIDLYQCHWADPGTGIDATMEAIEKLIEQGKIRASGVSNYSVEQMEQANAAVPLVSSQPPYSMINRSVESDVIPWCIEHNVGVLPYSPLQGGLLTGKITQDYEFNDGDHRKHSRFFRAENVRKVNAMLEQIRPIADSHNTTLGGLAINWTIRQPAVTAALVGARNPQQVEQNATATDFKLGEEEIRKIDELLDELKLDL